MHISKYSKHYFITENASLIYDGVILFGIQIEKIYMSSALKHSFIDCKMFDYM